MVSFPFLDLVLLYSLQCTKSHEEVKRQVTDRKRDRCRFSATVSYIYLIVFQKRTFMRHSRRFMIALHFLWHVHRAGTAFTAQQSTMRNAIHILKLDPRTSGRNRHRRIRRIKNWSASTANHQQKHSDKQKFFHKSIIFQKVTHCKLKTAHATSICIFDCIGFTQFFRSNTIASHKGAGPVTTSTAVNDPLSTILQ